MPIQENSTGVEIKLNIWENRSRTQLYRFDKREIILENPSGDVIQGSLTAVDLEKGEVKYRVGQDDLNESGLYEVQAVFEDTDKGDKFFTEVKNIEVEENLI